MKRIDRRFLGILCLLLLAGVTAALYFGVDRPEARTGSSDQDNPRKRHPAGTIVLDSTTGKPAVMPMTMNFVRTPDGGGPDGKGRFLIAVNSGYGIMFTSKSKAQQTVSVIDLDLKPTPAVIETLYFPSPQSANIGLVFDPKKKTDGTFQGYLSGGFENKIWILKFDPAAEKPLVPANEPDTQFRAPFIDVAALSDFAPTSSYNAGRAPVYTAGIALSRDGNALYTANNLGDTLGIVSDIRRTRRLKRIDLHRTGSTGNLYPYDVKVRTAGAGEKVYVSLWGDEQVAVVDPNKGVVTEHIPTGRHPTLMLFDKAQARLFVVNSDGDSVTVIDTATDKVRETISVKLGENQKEGESPEGLALSQDESKLFVANAHSNSVVVVNVSREGEREPRRNMLGAIPTGNYASAVAIAGKWLFIANGKGTGAETSSNTVTETGMYPNAPNENFPGTHSKRGMAALAVVEGTISILPVPDETRLFEYTQTAMRDNGLLGGEKHDIFAGGRSPFKHVVYVIRENRTYDQVFGDIALSGDGAKVDGDPSLAIFGNGEAGRAPSGAAQSVTPNAHALALRFGVFDRFFVNAEASPDGHNWSTAAFSTDYLDKAFRWQYSGRGRTYDYEGFNRLPSFEPPATEPPVALAPVFDLPASETDIANFMKRYVPYLNGGRDVTEPNSLYLWDAAKRAGLTYRNYGEFIGTVSEEDVKEVNTRKPKMYPDLSRNLAAFATKRSLEGHFDPQHKNFDLHSPDSFTTESYRIARESKTPIDPAIRDDNPDERFRGNSRYGTWSAEFKKFVADRTAGRGDTMPNLSVVRFPNDHTSGLRRGVPTPQFYVAENDYAVGRMIEDISNSPYWADTAIFIVEDDAQDGPDHVDAHRSPVIVVSAYNRPGMLIHEFHSTVSLLRTIELCLGIEPMNFLDSNATPMDLFGANADMRPYRAIMPDIALDNLYPPEKPSARMAAMMRLTDRQDLEHQDMADPRALNEIIWYSVMGDKRMPGIERLPAYALLTTGIRPDDDDDERWSGDNHRADADEDDDD